MAERLGAAPARLARRARRLFGYWRSERRTLRQGAVALVLSTFAGFVAGLRPGFDHGHPGEAPRPPRADPGVGRHARHDLRRDRRPLRHRGGSRYLRAHPPAREPPLPQRGRRVLSALLTSFYLAAVAKLVASAFADETAISFWDLVTISVVGGVLASLIILVFTVGTRRPVLPQGLGPGRRVHPDGHRHRGHGDASEPVPRDLPRRQRHRERGRRRALHGGDRCRPGHGVLRGASGSAGSCSRWPRSSRSRLCSTSSPGHCSRRIGASSRLPLPCWS